MDAPAVMLPATVLERIPFLRESQSRFFDFGTYIDKTSEQPPLPSVVVLTDRALVVASYPSTAMAPCVMPLQSIVGVVRDGTELTVRNSHMPDMSLHLPKADTFAVHLINLQDRTMNRALRLGAGEGGVADRGATGRSHPLTAAALATKALREAEVAATSADELDIGVVRLGYSSMRTTRPSTELDEGSDASSVQTLDHNVAEAPTPGMVDLPPVSIDAAALHRRLRYFFMTYDRSKLLFIDEIVARHRGQEAVLLRELEAEYGPEPNKQRWDTRDQMAHQRSINAQLRAQLRRAQDELLLLQHEDVQRETAASRVQRRKDELVALMAGHATASSDVAFEVLCVSAVDDPMERAYYVAPGSHFDDLKRGAARVPGANVPPLVVVTRDGTQQSVLCNRHFAGVKGHDCLGPFPLSVRRGDRWYFVPSAPFFSQA